MQWIDFAPILLEFFNVPISQTMQGTSLRERIASYQGARPAGLFGVFGGHVNVTDGRYIYMRALVRPENTPLFEYTLMPTHMHVRFGLSELRESCLAEPFSFTQGIRPLKIPARTYVKAHSFGTMLFDLANDPAQEHPVIDDVLETRMVRLMIEWMHWNDAPPEQFERLGLPIDGALRPEHLLCAPQHELVRQELSKRKEAQEYTGPGALYLTLPLQEVMDITGAAVVLQRHFSDLVDNSDFKQIVGEFSLQQFASCAPEIYTSVKLATFAADLAGHVKIDSPGIVTAQGQGS